MSEMNRVTVVFDDGGCITTDYANSGGEGFSRASAAFAEWKATKKVLVILQLRDFEIIDRFDRPE